MTRVRHFKEGTVKRRDFVRSAGAASAGLVLGRHGRLLARSAPSASWRTFEVTTTVRVLKPAGVTRVWVPAALIRPAPFQRTLANAWDAPHGSATLVRRLPDSLGIIAAVFPAGVPPALTVTSRIATRDYRVDLATPPATTARRAGLEHFLRPTALLPTDGIVKDTATAITAGKRTELDKARAIYEWIVEKTRRNPETRGCGLGDIRFMLETGDLTGKCADLNALFVGLARSAGLPARDVYGIRVAGSALGYHSLGVSSDRVTKAQHCRAEVFLDGYGWVPVDPADVRKVALEEPPGHRPLDDGMVARARARLFGSWEMNWIAYNFGHDVTLPGCSGAPLPFFMYPQAETARGRLDPLDPADFRYEITARETT
jgi:transglutaminase-like putative cysteine protease